MMNTSSVHSSNHFRCERLSPTRTVVTSFTPRRSASSSWVGDANGSCTEYEDGDWVLCLATPSTPSDDTIACALSNGNVQVYDQCKLLSILSNYFPHNKNNNQSPNNNGTTSSSANFPMITDLIYGPEHTLITTATNGEIIVTDIRQQKPALQCRAPESALSISLGYGGYLAAVGTTKGRIHFLDLRQGGRILASYIDSHTDAITQLQFCSDDKRNQILLSGSEDGLMCYFDTTQPTEELALQCVMNVGAPIRKIGFCHSDSVYCLTGSETSSMWNIQTGTCQYNFDNWDLRQSLSNEIQRSTGQHYPIDYLIDAYWDESMQQLQLAAGNNGGDCALFVLGTEERKMAWKVNHLLQGGHKGIVRAWQPLLTSSNSHGKSSTVVITAGEDARLCEWNRLGKQLHAMAPPSTVGTTGEDYLDKSWNILSKNSLQQPLVQRRPSLADANNNTQSATPRLGGGGGGPLRRHHRHKQASMPY